MNERLKPVSHAEVIKFLSIACRNWRRVPRLSRDDIDDVAIALTEFRDRAVAAETTIQQPINVEGTR